MGRSGKGAKRSKSTAQRPTRDAAAPAEARSADAHDAVPVAAGRRHRFVWIVVAMLVLAVGGAGWWLSRTRTPPEAPHVAAAASASSAVVASVSSVAYVDNRQCMACHEDAGRQWKQSHHFMAMALPTPESVRGDFDNTTFEHKGVTTRFLRRDGKYFVNTDGPDAKMADFEVKYTFGVDPLQQYLIATSGGRLQPLTIAWDVHRKRWFHLYPHETAPPGDVMHWSGRYQTANTMCIACHTTGYEKRYDAAADRFDTRWKESNVSCQACHGPGSAHVAWAREAGPGARTTYAASASGAASSHAAAASASARRRRPARREA